jgi:hypothetical protein
MNEVGQKEHQNNPRIIQYIATVSDTKDVRDDRVDWASSFAEWSMMIPTMRTAKGMPATSISDISEWKRVPDSLRDRFVDSGDWRTGGIAYIHPSLPAVCEPMRPQGGPWFRAGQNEGRGYAP